METKTKLSWPLGMLALPFLILATLGMALLTCVALTAGALSGKIILTRKH